MNTTAASDFSLGLRRFGVRFRLLLAFFGISAFAVIAATAAMYAFAEVGGALRLITEERVPAALASLELSRQADKIVTAAPALLAVTNESQHAAVARSIETEALRLSTLLQKLRGGSIDAGGLTAIEPLVKELRSNLGSLNELISSRLAIRDQKDDVLRRLSATNIVAQRLVAPSVMVLDYKISEWRRIQNDQDIDEDVRRAEMNRLSQDVIASPPSQKALAEVTAINDTLIRAAAANTPADLPLLAFPLRRSLETLIALAREFEPSLRSMLMEQIAKFSDFLKGPNSILSARREELEVTAKANALLQENATISNKLTSAVDQLVAGARSDIAAANAEVMMVQRLSSGVLIAIVALSLATSALIVWLYVGRNLIARLTTLGESMLAVANGNLHAPLPPVGQDEIGRMAMALSVFRDTAVEVEEQRLRERQAVLDTIDYGVLILDPVRVRIYNRAFIRLWGIDESILRAQPKYGTVIETARKHGVGFQEIPDSSWPAYVKERVAEVQAGRVAPREFRLNDGRILEFQVVVLPDGGRMVTYFDLTRLKRTEEALFAAKEEAERANRAKSTFLASMSHELRTPMNAIIGFTRLVMRHGAKVLPERDRGNLEKILTSANHLLGLINDILDLSKIEAGRTELKPIKVFLEPLIEECLRTIEPIVSADQVRLKKDVATDASVLFVDREKLTQILMNLLGNAAKFTEQGSISVVARKQSRMIAISVVDTGIGIRRELHENIFEEFRQIDDGGKRHIGTGLGLSISRRLARLMGGNITLESELGKGSTFTILLPADLGSGVPESSPALQIIEPVVTETQPVAQPANGNRHGLVLAIDDDPDVIDLLRQNLVDAGYHVEGALSGSEGLRKAREFQPSAITLDIKLSETDGWQVLHCLKADLVTCDIPVILLTVVDQKSLGYRLGASDYLVKPFDRGDLLTALSRVVPHF